MRNDDTTDWLLSDRLPRRAAIATLCVAVSLLAGAAYSRAASPCGCRSGMVDHSKP